MNCLRRFAIIGQRALAKGKLSLNDLAGGAGRMDVLIRGLMASLLTSHGIRENTECILHLYGGPGPARRIKFNGLEIKGMHADERSVAGLIAKVIREPLPPIGHWIERQHGIYDSGGTIEQTLQEWENDVTIILDAHQPMLWAEQRQGKPSTSIQSIGFVIGDDQQLPHFEHDDMCLKRSLGEEWLQGSAAISICHFILDRGEHLNLNPAA